MSGASVLLEYERVWTDGMNRGDVSAADRAFHPDGVFRFTGVPESMRGVEAWKGFVAAFLSAWHGSLIVDHLRGDRPIERWEQMDQTLLMQQLGLG